MVAPAEKTLHIVKKYAIFGSCGCWLNQTVLWPTGISVMKSERWKQTMKDLKHLIYFENLLQEANNELVQQANLEGYLQDSEGKVQR